MRILNEDNVLGYSGESYSREIKYEIDDDLKDCDIHFEFKKKKNKSSYMSNKIDITKRYMLPYDLLVEPDIIKIQMVAYRGNNFVKKSDVKIFYVKESINAVDVLLEEEHFSFKGEINEKVDKSFQKLSDDLGKVKLGIKGTTIPNDDFVENVYFNTKLGNEEVIDIINSLPSEAWIIQDNLRAYFIFIDKLENPDCPIAIGILNNTLYLIYDILGGAIYFTSEVFTADDGNTYNPGWQVTDEPIPINKNAISTSMGIEIGKYNNLLTSLISTTPFVEETLPEDSIEQVAFKINKKINNLEEKIGSETSSGGMSKKLVIDVAYSDLIDNRFNSDYVIDYNKFYLVTVTFNSQIMSLNAISIIAGKDTVDEFSGLIISISNTYLITLVKVSGGYECALQDSQGGNIDIPSDFSLKVYEI